MSIKHLASLNVTGSVTASNGVITVTTDGTPTIVLPDGAIAVDTTNDKIYFRSGGEWQEVIGGGGGGIAIQTEAPIDTGLLWLDTDEPGISGPTGPTGATGPAGVTTGSTAPANTSVIWADTSTTGSAVVPVGGTTGQVLSKSSGSDYDTAWATPVTSSDLALKANLASPTLTGIPSAPTAAVATNTTQIATTEFVRAEVSALVGGATSTLDTLAEIATALGNDASLATTLTNSIALKAPLIQASPIGMITPYAGATAPANWQLCYGQAISRTTYASLFAIISTTYGAGDGTTTFNLPDLRGRTVAGLDNMGGTDAGVLSTANTLGTTTGTETVTLTSAQSGVPAHSHANTVTNNAVTSGAGSAHQHANTVTNNTVSTSGVGNHTHYAHGGAFSGATPYTSGWNTEGAMRETSGAGAHDHTVTSNVTISNANESAHTHSVTSNVAISNVNNTAADAVSAHSNMQPTMTINYIILVGA